jgi:hypothetical protein
MHAARSGLVVALLFALGCGSGAGAKKESAGQPAGGGGGAAAAGAGPLTAADCERLLDHWFALVIADKKKTAKPDEVPTEEDVARARERLAASTRDKCVGSPRAPYECSMKAESTAEIRVCLEGKEKEP